MDVYSALADQTRREIIELLHTRSLSAGEIAARFPVSRPAISRHLRVLHEAGLVTVEQTGRERIYRFDPGQLEEMDTWLSRYRDRWSNRLDALETEVHRTRRERERQEQATTSEPPINGKVSA